MANQRYTKGLNMKGKWTITGDVGDGSYSHVYEGNVYSVLDSVSQHPAALKIPISKKGADLILTEIQTMRRLSTCECKDKVDIPTLMDSSVKPNEEWIEMELVGETLLKLFRNNAFSLKTTVMVGIKALEALQALHQCGFVHRDLKPDNIAISLDPASPKLFLIDFGISLPYLKNGAHVPYHGKAEFCGSPYFASSNSLHCIRATRRDDLESLCYILIFFAKGDLPWFQIDFRTFSSMIRMSRARETSTPEQLCKGLDPEFRLFLTYCKKLNFDEEPDYGYLRGLMYSMANSHGFTVDWVYDWTAAKGREDVEDSDCDCICSDQFFRKMKTPGNLMAGLNGENRRKYSVSRRMKELPPQLFTSPGEKIALLKGCAVESENTSTLNSTTPSQESIGVEFKQRRQSCGDFVDTDFDSMLCATRKMSYEDVVNSTKL